MRIDPEGVPGFRTPIAMSDSELKLDETAPLLDQHGSEIRERGWNI